MFTVKFWKDSLERAVKSGAQFVIFAWGLATVGPNDFVNALTFDWKLGGGAFLGGAILSILTSIVSEPFGPADSPNVVE